MVLYLFLSFFCHMKRFGILILVAFLLHACRNESAPDVSGIKSVTVVKRFDKAFFSIDTNQLDVSLNKLQQQYPNFLQDYMVKILGINPADPNAPDAIKSFIRSYGPVFETASAMADKTMPEVEKSLQQSLRYMQYYVPAWKPDSPFVVTTFIGPMDAFEPFPLGDYGDVRTRNGVGIALQLHLGKQADLYENGRQAGLFYDYQTRRFTPNMMVVNSVKNLIIDAFPYNTNGNTLVDEMIEKGKRLYLLDKLLPETADSLKLGYTPEQLKGCYANEALIWNYFVKNDLLYSKESAVNQNYIKDGPKTPELGEGAPGYIGLFVGRQLVRAYMKKHGNISIDTLMKIEGKEILVEAGYKP
ncbi:gliding motility lipoprotein GldB [soil metagenome]